MHFAILNQDGHRTESSRGLLLGSQVGYCQLEAHIQASQSNRHYEGNTTTACRRESPTEAKPEGVRHLEADSQIQGNRGNPKTVSNPILQEPQLRSLINLKPVSRGNPDKDVQPGG